MSTKFRPYSIIETTPSSKVIKNYQTYLNNNRLCWIVPISEFQDGLSNNLNIDVRTISNNYLNSTLYVVNPGRNNLYYTYCQGTTTHEGTSWEFKVNNTNLNRYYSNIQSVIQEAISAGYNYIYLSFQWNNSVLSQTVADFITGYDASTKFRPLSVFEVQPAPTIPVVLMPDGKYWSSIDLDIDDGLGEIFKYDNLVINGYTYNNQYFYSPASAKRVAASIPGYHLPTIEEWRNLANSISSSVTTVSNKLRSNYGWGGGNNGTDDYGFTVLPVGNMNKAYTGNASDIESKGSRTCYWCYDNKAVRARHDCVRIWNNNYGIQFADESSIPQYYFCFKVRLVKD